MKVELFDFQIDALHVLRKRIEPARSIASPSEPQAISLSAPTGSGKTIIMTALFEAILDTPDAQLNWPLSWVPQRDAIILWVSDMPELNEQTRRKIETKSNKVNQANRLRVIDSSLDAECLEGGCIYFINTQKLADDKLLTREGDHRAFSIWTTLTNTAERHSSRFYVVIDEAHRGMRGNGGDKAASIIQRFIKGHRQSGLVPMPLIIGISATPKRFNDLLEGTSHTVSRVIVPPEDVQESGLLKNRILIHHPTNDVTTEFGLLEEATRQWVKITDTWRLYCSEEGEETVRPVLVVQVEDGTQTSVTRTDLVAVIGSIEAALGRRLLDSEIAHALTERTDLTCGARCVRYLEPSRIQDDAEVGVVFFKMALSTGWDCPRAEVMMSFRRAEDHTYIAQLLGRMVRTPLARKVERRSELNDVHLLLPKFDQAAVDGVIEALQKSEDVPPTEAADARELVTLKRRPSAIPVFEKMQQLITYRVGAHREQSDTRRYQELARNLTIDGIDDDAWELAKEKGASWMSEQIRGLEEHGVLAELRRNLTKVSLQARIVESVTGKAQEAEGTFIARSQLDIDRDFEDAGRVLGNGLHQEFRKAVVGERGGANAKLDAIIFARNEQCRADLERKSKAAFNDLFDRYRSQFRSLPEHRRNVYRKLRAASRTPEPMDWQLQETIDFRRAPNDPTWEKHLYVEEDGTFRTQLTTWEADVLREELEAHSTLGWLRNQDRKTWSMELPYLRAGKIGPMYPDMLIVRQKSDETVVVDILEPHDSSRSDNVSKAKGLSTFAREHGDLFGRIQLIRAGTVGYARLDLNRSEVREQVDLIVTNEQLDELFRRFG